MHVHPVSSSRSLLAWPLLLAYPLLAAAGAGMHRPWLSLLGVSLAVTALCLPGLRRGRVLVWAGWLALVSVVAGLAREGMAGVALGTVPILIQLALAALFGVSLRRPRMPLVARLVEAIEGPARLAEPGVAAYARQVTVFWTVLLLAQATLLAWLTVCLVPGGWGYPDWLPSRYWTGAYVQFGSYLVLGLAFVGEYAVRRWRLRHLPHPSFGGFMRSLVLAWPTLVRQWRT